MIVDLAQRVRRVRYPLAIAIASTLGTFLFGWCSAYLHKMPPAPGDYFAMWKRWDALHFLTVAQEGYGYAVQNHQNLIAALPLYPAAIWLVHLIVREWHIAALVVSNVCCAGALIYLFLLAALEGTEVSARRAVLLFAIFPTAYFLHVAYSESLFLFLAIGCFYHARRGQWAVAALLAMFATAARVPGIALLPALAVEYLHQRRFRWRDVRPDMAWLALIPLGSLLYLWINYHYFGDPFFVVRAQREVWASFVRSPSQGLVSNWEMFWYSDNADRLIRYGAPFLAFVVGSIAVVESYLRLRPAYTVYLALNWFAIFCNNLTFSSPRYLLGMFPLFLIVARITRRPGLRDALIILSLLFYALCTTQFIRGWWAF